MARAPPGARGIESGELVVACDAVFAQRELLIERGESRQRDVVDRLEFAVAVLGELTVKALAVPVGRRGKGAADVEPLVVGLEDVDALAVETRRRRPDCSASKSALGEVEPPQRLLRSIIAPRVGGSACREGLEDARGASSSKTSLRRHRGRRSRSEAVAHSASLGASARGNPRGAVGVVAALDDLVVLDHQWRVGETVVDATDPHEGRARRRCDAPSHVGEAGVEDQFDALGEQLRRVRRGPSRGTALGVEVAQVARTYARRWCFGLASPTFDLGRTRRALRVRDGSARDEGDPVDAGVDLGAAQE